MRHQYRKGYEYDFEAEETAQAFNSHAPIDGRNIVEAWTAEQDGKHWVYVILEGNMDPDEVLLATGFERIG